MKSLTLLAVILIICFQSEVYPQSCLPEGITLTTQAQIDNFQTNHPNCTEIEGAVVIQGNDISNLNGLNVLTSIGGYLFIKINQALTNLTGLESLTSIGGDLNIDRNNALISLAGLDNLTSVGGSLQIGGPRSHNTDPGNPSLISLSGLESLSSIGGNLIIDYNIALISLAGLENLASIGGGLQIGGNDSFYSGNPFLTSLSGLDDLSSIRGDLSIVNNNSLSTCDAGWLCEYLAAPNGAVNIYGNATGCNSVIEVAYPCGCLPCLPYGNYDFRSQSDINLFQATFPNCSALQGYVFINGNDITDLSGLDAVTSIGGGFSVWHNDALTSLSGLDNLDSIGGDLFIYANNALTSLSGLDSLTSIGGGLRIRNNDALTNLSVLDNLTSVGGYLKIDENDALTSLSGLDNLASIGGYLYIFHNDALTSLSGLDNLTSIGDYLEIITNHALTSLSGLDNIEVASITDLYIAQNTSLSTCEVQSVCDYLAAPNGTVSIHGNAPGCNSQQEVEEACGIVGTDELQVPGTGFRVEVYPNPASDVVVVSVGSWQPVPESEASPGSAVSSQVILKIYDLYGREVRTLMDEMKSPGEYTAHFNISGLPAGVYLVRMDAGSQRAVKKLLVQ